jgi:hypothetical protein
MCQLETYLPHREFLPRRYCDDCGCLLSSGNETSTCHPCVPGWSEDIDLDGPLSHAVRISIGNALDEILANA